MQGPTRVIWKESEKHPFQAQSDIIFHPIFFAIFGKKQNLWGETEVLQWVKMVKIGHLLVVWKSPFKDWKFLKNLKVGVIETDLSKFLSYFGKQPIHILKAGDQ